MTVRWWGLAGLVGAIGLSSVTVALPQDPQSYAAVMGRVRDRASRGPIFRARVCSHDRSHGRLPCAPADTAGSFRLSELLAGRQQLLVYCETGRLTFDERMLDTLTITPREGERMQRDFRVPSAGCDQRPYEIVAGEFTGHWASGFELDDFVPCTDSLKHAWVERRGLRPGELWYLPAGEPYGRGQRWFVRWRGVWMGPRNVLIPYQMVVDSVIEMRLPGPGDCTR